MSFVPAAAGLFAAFSWALASLLFARVLRGTPGARPTPAAANLFKGLLALGPFCLVWAVVGGGLPAGRDLAWLLASGVLGFTLGDTFFFAALPRCGVQTAAMVGQLNVPIAALLAWAWMGQALSPRTLVWIGIALAGVSLVVLDAPPKGATWAARERRARRTGVLLALLTALVHASSVVTGHRSMGGVDVVPGTVIRLVGGMGGLVLLSLAIGVLRRNDGATGELRSLLRPAHTPAMWRALVPAAIFGAVLGLLPYHLALRELPGGVSALLFSTAPLFTLPLGLLFGERHGWRAAVGTLVGYLGVVGVVTSLEEPRLPPPEVLALESPAGAPSRWPSLVPLEGGGVALSWIEGDAAGEVHLRLSQAPEPDLWNAPVTVASGADWFVNWADFPQIANSLEGAWLATWLQKNGPGTFAYSVHYARSTDSGESWSAPAPLHRDRSETEHGFVSLQPLADGGFHTVWLDGRNTAPASSALEHGTSGAMALYARTLGPDGSLGDEVVLDERVCECCQTASTLLADGALVVAWRDRSQAEIRDVAWSRGFPGDPSSWSSPRIVHADGWLIRGCPVNGPSLDAQGERVALAWYTLADERPRAAVALSADAGRSFGSPLVVAEDDCLGRVDVVFLKNGALLVSWLQGPGPAASWCARVVDGRRLGEVATIADAAGTRADGFLRLARDGRRVIAAWTDASSTLVRLATLEFP